jgi:hypothetical protein
MLKLTPLLERFAERTPLPVLARGVLERCLDAPQLDAWFESIAERQYTRKLLFSQVYGLMTQVVFRHQPSINTAYQNATEPLGVSLTSVYNKLNGIEPHTSAALVRFSAQQAEALIREVGGTEPALLPGLRVKVLDGNALGKREHRLTETRGSSAAPLPGKTLDIYEPELGLITHSFPCEDAYTQERALLPAVLETVEADDLVLADRNFCTTEFLTGLGQRNAMGLIREHAQIRYRPLEAVGEAVRIDGASVSEQRVQLMTGGEPGITLRRIWVELDTPDRNGERIISLLTHVPVEKADAQTLATLYRKRWRIEVAFLQMTVQLRCEINTLGYPRAALFGFSVAAVAFNTVAVVMAALRAAHPKTDIQGDISTYYIANEMANMAESLDTIIDPEDWQPVKEATVSIVGAWLLWLAGKAQLRKYTKHPRGKKKPMPAKKNDPAKPHVSTARVLSQRKDKNSP